MKKYFFFAAAALVALAACSKVTPVAEPDQEIAFKVINYVNSTKADDAAGHKEYTGTFGVFAYANNEVWDNANSTTGNVYMNNVAISKVTVNNSSVWKNAQTAYFWPKKAKLTFAAYSPYNATAPTFAKATGFKFSNYTIPAEADVDLMVADLAKDLTGNVTTAEATEGDGGYHYTQGVPLLFHHLLTSLQFKFQQAPYDNPNVVEADSKIIVTAVELRNFVGSKTYDNNVWDANTTASNANYTVYSDNTGTAIAKVSANNPTLIGAEDVIIMPQTLVAAPTNPTAVPTDATETSYQLLKVTYNISTKYNTGSTLVEEGIVAYVPFNSTAITAFTKNQKIVYTVTIKPYAQDEILFDPAVKNWDETTGTLSIK